MARCRARFIADAMLGSLARWLRMLGCDTLYARDWHDARILEEAAQTGRIVLTRDRGLYRRALKRGIDALLVAGSLEDALARISLLYGVELHINPDESRCPLCNAPLRRVSKEEVRGHVPPAVLELHDAFWVCTGCGQVYWRGGHWRGIEETLRRASRRARRLAGRGAGRSRASS